MGKSTSLSNAILDAAVSNLAAGNTTTIGTLTLVMPIRCTFLSDVSTADNSGPEWSGNLGYPVGGVDVSGSYANPAAIGQKTNTASIIVTNAPGGTWAANELVDSNTPAQRLYFGPDTSLGKTVNDGDTCVIPIGSLVNSEF